MRILLSVTAVLLLTVTTNHVVIAKSSLHGIPEDTQRDLQSIPSYDNEVQSIELDENGETYGNYYDRNVKVYSPRYIPPDCERSYSRVGNDVILTFEYEGWEAPGFFDARTVDVAAGRNFTAAAKSEQNIEIKSATVQAFSRDSNGLLVAEEDAQTLQYGEAQPGDFLSEVGRSGQYRDINSAVRYRYVYRIIVIISSKYCPCVVKRKWIRLYLAFISFPAYYYWLPYFPLPTICNDCYSYAGIKMASHGETLQNCGGRTCKCFNGKLECEASCKQRRAYHTISDEAKQRFVDAVLWVNSQESDALGTHLGTNVARSYDKVLEDHAEYSNAAHRNPKFLPWHRCYLCEFEQMLQLYDVCVTIPFWYHPVDSVAGQLYHVLDDNYLGDEIDPYGQLGSWSVPPTYTNTPFSRGGNNNNPPLASATQLASLLAQPDYASFRPLIEGWTHHGLPHVAVGGNMGGIESPADPLFWLHHGNIDRSWAVWQTDYGHGSDYAVNGDVTEVVSPQWGVLVEDVLNDVGVFAPSVTIYENNRLPIGDHCAVCYRRLLAVPHTPSAPVIRDASFDFLISQRFSLEELSFREQNDITVLALIEANNYGSEAELLRADCSSLSLPTGVKLFGQNFGFDDDCLQEELCSILNLPVKTETTVIKFPFGWDFEDYESDCEIRERLEIDFIEIRIVISVRELEYRLTKDCDPSLTLSPTPAYPLDPPTSSPTGSYFDDPTSSPTGSYFDDPTSSPTDICINNYVIDFETDGAGELLKKGDVINDSVVFSQVTFKARRSQRGPNGDFLDGMIFDTNSPSGDDFDLAQDLSRGNILIITADNDSSDPDDAGQGGVFVATFAMPVTLISLVMIDLQKPAVFEFFGVGSTSPFETRNVVGGSDGSVRTIDLLVANVSRFTITLTGSGAVDDVTFSKPCII